MSMPLFFLTYLKAWSIQPPMQPRLPVAKIHLVASTNETGGGRKQITCGVRNQLHRWCQKPTRRLCQKSTRQRLTDTNNIGGVRNQQGRWCYKPTLQMVSGTNDTGNSLCDQYALTIQNKGGGGLQTER